MLSFCSYLPSIIVSGITVSKLRGNLGEQWAVKFDVWASPTALLIIVHASGILSVEPIVF